MNIIKKIEGSVIWIKSDAEKGKNNLINEARKGVNSKNYFY